MTTQQLLRKIGNTKYSKIDKQEVVTLPLAVYDEMREYIEMYSSEKYRKDIAQARADKKTYTFEEVKKMLAL